MGAVLGSTIPLVIGAVDSPSFAWGPTVRDVALHIPSRTRRVTDNEPAGTFDADTTPTGDQVQTLIGRACVWVSGRAGSPLAAAAYPLAGAAAALWAAYWVELGWPERDGQVSVYSQLRADAEALTAQAAAVNLAAGGGVDVSADSDGLPDRVVTWSFPPLPADRVL